MERRQSYLIRPLGKAEKKKKDREYFSIKCLGNLLMQKAILETERFACLVGALLSFPYLPLLVHMS